jgi:hypothetical protein
MKAPCAHLVGLGQISVLHAFSEETDANSHLPISVALSIMKKDAYFSHASAMWIHGLGKDHRNVFINKEQSQKDTSSTPLSQEAIHRAFRNKQRRSKLFYKYEENTITVLSGKHTARNGVVSATAPSGHKVDVTSIERTLIDITVRQVMPETCTPSSRHFVSPKIGFRSAN